MLLVKPNFSRGSARRGETYKMGLIVALARANEPIFDAPMQ